VARLTSRISSGLRGPKPRRLQIEGLVRAFRQPSSNSSSTGASWPWPISSVAGWWKVVTISTVQRGQAIVQVRYDDAVTTGCSLDMT
jgi:hypothetical protein